MSHEIKSCTLRKLPKEADASHLCNPWFLSSPHFSHCISESYLHIPKHVSHPATFTISTGPTIISHLNFCSNLLTGFTLLIFFSFKILRQILHTMKFTDLKWVLMNVRAYINNTLIKYRTFPLPQKTPSCPFNLVKLYLS